MPNTKLIADKKLHVFIADDDIEDIEYFRNALDEVSKEVKITVASSSMELMQFLSIVMPDIIFLDINMPVMDGIACLTVIRQDDRYKNIPIIIYSTTSYKEHIDKTYELGASMYFEKPSNFEIIKKRLKEILLLKTNDLQPQLPRDKYVINDK